MERMADTENTAGYDILLIQTGGTIDKDYPNRVGGYAFEIGSPASGRVLGRARPAYNVHHVTVCQKDSQDITDQDRDSIWKACRDAQCRLILVTHGTDTMIDTAVYLGTKGLPGRRIVITGAHLPETFKASEADFNIGVAVGALQANSEEDGIFVAMSGCLYPWYAVTRHPDDGTFIHKH